MIGLRFKRRAHDGIGWIEPEMVATMRFFDRFPRVHQDGKAEVRASLKRFLGIPGPKPSVVPTRTPPVRHRRVRPL